MSHISLKIQHHLLIIILFFVSITQGVAQETTDELRRPVQLTFCYPIGSNGTQAVKYVNNVSVNMLIGMSRGVEGVEVGGLANGSLGNIDGVQAAGILNSSLGYLKGLQLGGIANFNRGEMVGVQAAGIANVNTHKANGLQLSGITNLSTKTVDGAQISGIINVNAENVFGAQISGIANTVAKNTHGAQISGIANVTPQKLDGVQAGLINYARNVKGFQLGLINVSDSVEKGAALGLISFVRHGYHRVEIETNETFYINATVKSGLPWLYNIYTVSFKTRDNKTYWAPGIGLGTLFPINSKLNTNIDLIAKQVNEDEWWTDELNMLNTLKINFSYKMTDRIEFYGGPSFNVVVSGIEDAEGNIIGESFSPKWGLSSKTHQNNQVKTYLGFNLGVRL